MKRADSWSCTADYVTKLAPEKVTVQFPPHQQDPKSRTLSQIAIPYR